MTTPSQLDMLLEHGEKGASGQIVTFYSFKGGVGRTMAMANVGFLAACNGLRVLVMDWDLEAPGLAYYFRGLLEAGAINKLKSTEGVLNVLWSWVNELSDAKRADDLDRTLRSFRRGTPFDQCVRELLDDRFLERGGQLDYIGAGSRIVHAPTATEYEDALAKFPWSDFFEKYAGGVWTESLREWAKRNYDLVLIDSRTGLAEAAGLCTMHLPDAVVLCFILNRQNIDGVSRIAAAIRTKREGQVRIHTAPMRVARKETSEESDARAKALTELTRIGGLSKDVVQQQLRALQIAQEENVPFYESLAPFVAEDPKFDDLTLSYLRFGSEVIGMPLSLERLDPKLVASFRARLQPRQATAEYVQRLVGAEPTRAIEELQRLIESAQELAIDGGDFEESYAEALINAAFSLPASEPHLYRPIADIQRQAVDFLRLLLATDEKWALRMTETLELYLASSGAFLEPDEELTLLEELDVLLTKSTDDAAKLRRAINRRRVAWIYSREDQLDAANQTIGEVLAQVSSIRSSSDELLADPPVELNLTEGDMRILRGVLLVRRGELDAAREEFEHALTVLATLPVSALKLDARRLLSDAHRNLALLPSSGFDSAASHALDAVKWFAGPQVFNDLSKLIEVVSGAGWAMTLEFLENALGVQDRTTRNSATSYFSRTPRQAVNFLELAVRIVQLLAPPHSSRDRALLRVIGEVADNVVIKIARRRVTMNEKSSARMLEAHARVVATLQKSEMPYQVTQEVQDALDSLLSGRQKHREDLL